MTAEAFKLAGNAAFKRGEYTDALREYSRAIQLDSSNSVYWLNRAATHLKLAAFTAAESDSTAAISLDSSSSKAFYRRGVSRRFQSKYDEAQADLNEAKRLGGGNEVDVELALIEAALKEEKVAFPTTNPTTSRLLAFLSPPPPPAAALTSSPLTGPTSATASTTASPSSNEFMKEVSTRRTPTRGNGSFVAQKEKRDSKLSFSSTSTRVSNAAIDREAKPSTIVESTPPPIELSLPNPPPSAIIIPSPVTPEPRIHATASIPPPQTVLAFESSWSSLSSLDQRRSFLQTLDVSTLPSVFGSNLTPELLEQIIHSLITTQKGSGDDYWIIPFLSSLKNVNRFSMIVGFLDEESKSVLRDLFVKVKHRIAELESSWEV